MAAEPPSQRPLRFDRDAVLAAAGPKLDALKKEARDAAGLLRGAFGFAVAIPIVFVGSALFGGFAALPFLAFLGFIVFVAVVGLRAAKRLFAARSGVLEAIAPALGLAYWSRAPTPIDLSAFDGTYYGPLFKYVRCDDLLSGARGETAFQVFDAKVTARSKGPDGKWRYGEPPKWLEGFVFAATRLVRVEIPDRWTSRTVILQDQGMANRLQQPKGMESVRLVDARFEKIFEVFSTDQTEARALLDPALMERLVALEELFEPPSTEESPPPAMAAFADGVLLAALPFSNGRAWQELKSRVTSADIDRLVVDQILWEIDAVLGVVDAVTGRSGKAARHG